LGKSTSYEAPHYAVLDEKYQACKVKRTGEEMAVDAAPVTCMEGLRKTTKSEENSARIAGFLVYTETRRQHTS
jgi:hypothetical protein